MCDHDYYPGVDDEYEMKTYKGGLPYYRPPEVVINQLYRLIDKQAEEIEYWKNKYKEQLDSSMHHANEMNRIMITAALDGAFISKEKGAK